MKPFNITLQEKRALAVATVIAVVFAGYFLSAYFIMFVIAAVLAYLFNPVYRWFLKKNKRPSVASGWTLLISILSIVIPVTLVFFIAGFQLQSTFENFSQEIANIDLNEAGEDVVEIINDLLDKIPFIDVTVTQESLTEALTSALQSFGENIMNSIANIAGSFGSFITTFIIYIYVFLSILRNSDKILLFFKKLNPLGDQISDLYISRAAAMVRGTVKGQFIIAAVQGFLGAATVALVGYADLFFVLFILFTMLSVIPLGAGIVLIPLGFFMILTGNVVGGVIVILEHLLINTNVDNVLRPKLVPLEARLDSALMLVSVFAGISFFGFLGIVIGPTIMVIIVATVRVYLDVYENYQVIEPDESSPKKAKKPRRRWLFGK